MAIERKQTRRSISVRGTTYESLRRYCEQHQLSMSEVVEEQLGGGHQDRRRRACKRSSHPP